MLHAVAATSELHDIRRRLAAMERKLSQLVMEQDAEWVSRLEWAAHTLESLRQEHANTGVMTADMLNRLALVERDVFVARNRSRHVAAHFRATIDEIRGSREKDLPVQAVDFLKNDRGRALFHARMLAQAASLHLLTRQVHALAAAQDAPLDLDRRLAELAAELEQQEEHVTLLSSLDELSAHARECLERMGRFRRLLARSADKVLKEEAETSEHRDGEGITEAYSYILWQDQAGSPRTRLLPPARVETEKPDGLKA